MIASNSKTINQAGGFDFLEVDNFIRNFIDAQALSIALETGLVDWLIRHGSTPAGTLAGRLGADEKGIELLLDILRANRVVEDCDGAVVLSREFTRVLPCRDLLELKIDIANLAARDILNHGGDLICRPREFAQKAGFYRLFSGDGGPGSGEGARQAANRWMRITTTLTKYEARACLRYFDFSRSEYVLDVGGNSGEFALRICRAHPQIYATVFDLPLVCEIGSGHVRAEPEADRISFVGGNALTDVLPGGFDIVCFKSMLHDWPEPEAKGIMAGAARSLKPGGTMLIFERSLIENLDAAPPYSSIPFLLFFSGYRPPEFYAGHLHDLGFRDIRIRKIELDMPFVLVTGSRA